jgi:phospholipid N-methyltransferase
MTDRSRSGLREHLLLLGRFLRSPSTVGAVAPSSQALAAEIVRDIPSHTPERVVELGPGTGAFTEAIVRRLGGRGRFLAVEIEPVFVEQIRRRFPEVDCVCASAADLDSLAASHGVLPVDHVISGLPFASLPPDTTSRIVQAIERSLRPGGTFTTFQYLHASVVPRALAFRRDMKHLFGEPRTRVVFRNFPPARVFTWTRQAH